MIPISFFFQSSPLVGRGVVQIVFRLFYVVFNMNMIMFYE